MKKNLFIMASAILLSSAAFAQDSTMVHHKRTTKMSGTHTVQTHKHDASTPVVVSTSTTTAAKSRPGRTTVMHHHTSKPHSTKMKTPVKRTHTHTTTTMSVDSTK